MFGLVFLNKTLWIICAWHIKLQNHIFVIDQQLQPVRPDLGCTPRTHTHIDCCFLFPSLKLWGLNFDAQPGTINVENQEKQ
jgi:hypothetical protein